jgi:hypothetical protein
MIAPNIIIPRRRPSLISDPLNLGKRRAVLSVFMTHSKGNPIPQILTAVKTLLPMIPGAINKDIATPILKAGTKRIRAIKAEVLAEVLNIFNWVRDKIG